MNTSPPEVLGAAGRAFWLKATQENNLDSAHDEQRLLMAAKTLDEIAAVEKQVQADGMFVKNRYGATIEHVGMKSIRDLRTLFVRIVREMGLDLEAPADSRPPRRY